MIPGQQTRIEAAGATAVEVLLDATFIGRPRVLAVGLGHPFVDPLAVSDPEGDRQVTSGEARGIVEGAVVALQAVLSARAVHEAVHTPILTLAHRLLTRVPPALVLVPIHHILEAGAAVHLIQGGEGVAAGRIFAIAGLDHLGPVDMICDYYVFYFTVVKMAVNLVAVYRIVICEERPFLQVNILKPGFRAVLVRTHTRDLVAELCWSSTLRPCPLEHSQVPLLCSI